MAQDRCVVRQGSWSSRLRDTRACSCTACHLLLTPLTLLPQGQPQQQPDLQKRGRGGGVKGGGRCMQASVVSCKQHDCVVGTKAADTSHSCTPGLQTKQPSFNAHAFRSHPDRPERYQPRPRPPPVTSPHPTPPTQRPETGKHTHCYQWVCVCMGVNGRREP
jgi:hypothetical protein